MTVTTAFAEKRIALVIGNSQYGAELGNLQNPVHDATDISKKLRKFGFQVTTLKNGTQRKMDEAISSFGQKIAEEGTIGLFYFAGHGIQVQGANYLIPIKSGITSEADVKYKAVNAGQVLSQMDLANNGLNLVILDACRNNPFARSFRSATRGLARMDAPTGSLILYATKPGQVAQDGSGRNGVFTEQLLKSMSKTSLRVEDVFKQAAISVSRKTSKEQEPWMEGVLYGDFYFDPKGSQTVASIAPKQPIFTSSSSEDTFIKHMDQNDPAQMKLYLEQYPAGKLSALFKLKLKSKEVLEHTLTIRSNVHGDTVFVNGKDYGSTRVDLKLKSGEHTIKIEKEGYNTFEKTIQLASNQTVRGILSEVPKPPQTNWDSSPVAVQALQKQKTNIPKSRSWREPTTGMEFVWIPKACFDMGSTSGDSDELPTHNACFDGFWIGKTEVTQGQWIKVMGNNPAHFYKIGECKSKRCPVESVSWNEIQKFIKKLNSRSNKLYRLPTEAEWEYACKGGAKQTFSGSNSIENVAWFGGNSKNKTHVVAKKNANNFGLHDMSGNVWEWVQDWYSEDAYQNHKRNNPLQNTSSEDRVLRGGSWRLSSSYARCANRYYNSPGYRLNLVGFRLVMAGN
jgi:formylglycine-generating enzyme required for sulfatase activity